MGDEGLSLYLGRYDLVPAAFFGAVADFVPVSFPFFAPLEGEAADRAGFFREVRLFVGHGLLGLKGGEAAIDGDGLASDPSVVRGK